MIKSLLISSCLFFGINPPLPDFITVHWDPIQKPSIINTASACPKPVIEEISANPPFEYIEGASVDCVPEHTVWTHYDYEVGEWGPSTEQLKECPHRRHWGARTEPSTCHGESWVSGTDTPWTLYINGLKTNSTVWTHKNHQFTYGILVAMPEALKVREAVGFIGDDTQCITPSWTNIASPDVAGKILGRDWKMNP